MKEVINNKVDNDTTEKDERKNYLDTEIQTAFVYIGKILFRKICKAAGIKTGNPNHKELAKLLEEMPVIMPIVIGGLLPAIEEILLRYLPNLLVQNEKGMAWKAGIPTNVIFALLHMRSTDESGRKYFKTDTIPIDIFLHGLFLWYLMRERGIDHSILSHITHNSTAIVLSKLFSGNGSNSGRGAASGTNISGANGFYSYEDGDTPNNWDN